MSNEVKFDLKKIEQDSQFLVKTGKQLERKLNRAIRTYEERLAQCEEIEACERKLKSMHLSNSTELQRNLN